MAAIIGTIQADAGVACSRWHQRFVQPRQDVVHLCLSFHGGHRRSCRRPSCRAGRCPRTASSICKILRMPVASGLFDHALDLRTQNHRVPQGIRPGGKAFVAFVDAGHHRLIVGFDFVRRVDQHQAATGNRRQFGLAAGSHRLFPRGRGCLSGIQNAAAGSRLGAARSTGCCPARAAADGRPREPCR